jgi:membrane-bound ClpP family serine protease
MEIMEILLSVFGLIAAFAIFLLIQEPLFMNWLFRKLGLQGDSKLTGAHAMKGRKATIESKFVEEEGEITGIVWIEGERWKAQGSKALLELQKGEEVVVKDVIGLVLEVQSTEK